MIKRQIKLERSPFMKTRDMTAPKGSELLETQVSQDMFNDFMLYAQQYNEEHNVPKTRKGNVNRATPLKQIINEFLNSHAFERKCFDDLYVIMACNPIDFNKDAGIHPDVDGAIIGFVDTPEKFTKFHPFRAVHDRFNESKLIYALQDFNKDTFDMLNLSSFDREVLFGIEPAFYKDFDDLKTALSSIYEPIEFDNARICMFNLNNYFDIQKDGVFVSKQSKYEHDGVVVLIDPRDIYKNDRVILRVKWSYNAGVLTCKCDVEALDFFNAELCNELPEAVYNDYWNISSGLLDISAKYEFDYKNSNLRLIMLKQNFKKEFLEERQRNAHLKQWLDDHKQP